jgi:hypothetical protein
MAWLRKLFAVDAPSQGPLSSVGDTPRGMVERGARARTLEPDDVAPGFLSSLLQIFADEGHIASAWLIWVGWPGRADEVGISIRSDSTDRAALERLCARIDALGGPQSFAAFASGNPTDAPFSVRSGAA